MCETGPVSASHMQKNQADIRVPVGVPRLLLSPPAALLRLGVVGCGEFVFFNTDSKRLRFSLTSRQLLEVTFWHLRGL